MQQDSPILEYSSPLGNGPPPGCRVLIEHHADGITFTDPPHGLRSVAGRLISAVVTALVGLLCSSVSVYEAITDSSAGAKWALVPAVVFGFFAVVAIVACHATWKDALTPLEISARSRSLTVRRGQRLLGRKRIWKYDQLDSITIRVVGPTTKLQMIGNLLVKPKRGFAYQVVMRRPTMELKWIARMLNETLRKAEHSQISRPD